MTASAQCYDEEDDPGSCSRCRGNATRCDRGGCAANLSGWEVVEPVDLGRPTQVNGTPAEVPPIQPSGRSQQAGYSSELRRRPKGSRDGSDVKLGNRTTDPVTAELVGHQACDLTQDRPNPTDADDARVGVGRDCPSTSRGAASERGALLALAGLDITPCLAHHHESGPPRKLTVGCS